MADVEYERPFPFYVGHPDVRRERYDPAGTVTDPGFCAEALALPAAAHELKTFEGR